MCCCFWKITSKNNFGTSGFHYIVLS